MPAEDPIRARLARLMERITAALWNLYRPGVGQAAAAAGAAARAQDITPARVADLLATYQRAMAVAGLQAGDVTADFVRQAATYGLADATTLLAAAGAPVDPGLVQVANTAEGPLRDLLVARVPEHADQVGRVLVEGAARGWAPARIAAETRRAAGGPFRNAVLVARTEAMRAHRTASLTTYQANPMVSRWRWSARNTSRTCPACWARDGQIYANDRPLGSHPACMCVTVPVVEGVSDGPPEGPRLFARLDAATQNQILGPAKGAAYRAGAFRLEDVVATTHSPAWGEGVRVKRLGELVGPDEAARFLAAARAR